MGIPIKVGVKEVPIKAIKTLQTCQFLTERQTTKFSLFVWKHQQVSFKKFRSLKSKNKSEYFYLNILFGFNIFLLFEMRLF